MGWHETRWCHVKIYKRICSPCTIRILFKKVENYWLWWLIGTVLQPFNISVMVILGCFFFFWLPINRILGVLMKEKHKLISFICKYHDTKNVPFIKTNDNLRLLNLMSIENEINTSQSNDIFFFYLLNIFLLSSMYISVLLTCWQ